MYFFDHITIDFVEPLLTSKNRYNLILLIIDVATRFIVLEPL
jgi:hypothetical protein